MLNHWRYQRYKEIWAPDPNENREQDEHAVCKHFGCGVHLTAAESLYGDLCLTHSSAPKPKMVELIDRYMNK